MSLIAIGGDLLAFYVQLGSVLNEENDLMTALVQDLRYAIRQLLKAPGFSLTAMLSLTLGIAATSAVFSVVWAVVMNPYPYAAPDRMMHLRLRSDKPGEFHGFGVTANQWQQFRQAPVVEDAVITESWNLTVTGKDIPEDVNGCYMSSNAFQFFGVPAALGRGLLPSDAVNGSDPQSVVVLGYKFWKRRYGGDPSMVGKTIEMLHKPYTVIGVAAPRFTWDDADVYVPLKATADTVRNYNMEIRLKPGVSVAQAEQQLQPYITRFEQESPNHFALHPGALHLEGLNERFLHEIGATLGLLFGAVALLLAIGCANVSILLLARGTARQHEFALRAALGASRGRIVRQLLTEALLLSGTGAITGILLAYKLIDTIVALLPENSFPHEAAITVNLPVLLFTSCVAFTTGVLFGISPALRLSRCDVREALQSAGRKFAGSMSDRSTSNLLVAGQISITLLLITTAGAAIQGFLKLTRVPLGYNPHQVMSVSIAVHENTHKTLADRTAYFSALLHKVAQTSGVTKAAISTNATPPANGGNAEIEVLGDPSNAVQKARGNWVSAGFFPLLEIPLDRGRLWSGGEEMQAAKVAVVNETLAHKYFPNGNAIGHSLRTKDLKSEPPYFLVAEGAASWIQIIGVVADKLDDGLNNPVLPEFFTPYTLAERMGTQILVKTQGPPTALLHAIALQVTSVDADQQIGDNAADLEHWISGQTEYRQGQLISWLFGAFAALALVLAAIGLYSVVSYTVAQRTNEFGIRIALGALRGDVLRLVFQSAVVSVSSGIAAGLVLVYVMRTVMERWSPTASGGALPLVTAVVVLAVVALTASAIPAWRAARVEPNEALRCE